MKGQLLNMMSECLRRDKLRFVTPIWEMGNVALYNYVNKLHIEILYLWVNIVILLDSNNEMKKIGDTAPLTLDRYG